MIHWKVNVFQMVPYPSVNLPSFQKMIIDTMELDELNCSFDEINKKAKLFWQNYSLEIIPVSDEAKNSTKFEI